MWMSGAMGMASAQTVDVFSGPQAAPQTPNNQTSGELPFPGPSPGVNAAGPVTSGMYGQYLSQAEATAPPWILTEHVGINEIATDNINFPASGPRKADLSSLFSGGGILTADTSWIYGTAALTGVYRVEAVNSKLDSLLGYGYANEMVSLLPGTLYMGLHGLMDEIYRVGLGVQNPLAQLPDQTQTYQVSASPLLYSRIDNLTFNLLRYEIGQIWVNRNTGAINAQGVHISPISNSTGQIARDDFRMDGTVFARLLTDVSLSGSEFGSFRGTDDFTKEKGEVINEYALTHSLALIGAIGYERLHDRGVPPANGEDPMWSFGARYLPNADSFVLLTYGHNDLKSDFAGELAWQVTPLTSVYMDYTDSIITLQQLQIANNNASNIGPSGARTHIAFDESPVISTLGDPLLIGPPSPDSPPSSMGIPLNEVNNVLPLQNGLFRVKAFRASGSTLIDNDNEVILTFMNFDQTQLSTLGQFPVGRPTSLQQVVASWGRSLSPEVQGRIALRYGHESIDQSGSSASTSGDRYGASLVVNWQISETLGAQFRYDFNYFDAHPSSVNADQNVLSVGVYKTFD